LKHLLYEVAGYSGSMPVELWNRLQNFIVAEIVRRGVPMDEIHWDRWQYVREEFHRGVPWGDAFANVSAQLENSPAAGDERTIYASYLKIEKLLPPDQRRKLTYRKPRATTTS